MSEEDRIHQHARGSIPVATKAWIIRKEDYMAGADSLTQCISRKRDFLFVLRADEPAQLQIIFRKIGGIFSFSGQIKNGTLATLNFRTRVAHAFNKAESRLKADLQVSG